MFTLFHLTWDSVCQRCADLFMLKEIHLLVIKKGTFESTQGAGVLKKRANPDWDICGETRLKKKIEALSFALASRGRIRSAGAFILEAEMDSTCCVSNTPTVRWTNKELSTWMFLFFFLVLKM